MKLSQTTQSSCLDGKTALITGGASGIGAAAALQFSEQGARVAVLDIQEEEGNQVVETIKANGGEAIFVPCDVSRAESVDKAINEVISVYGVIDSLFNHAGTIIVKKLHESTEEDYDRLMNINAKSAFLVCRKVVPHMVENGGGSIVITSSIGGEKGFALESIYCMSKGAVLQLARSIAIEYREQGIRCNAVCPGFVKTAHGLHEIDELDGLGQNWDDSELKGAQVRICESDEVASAAMYLLSDSASFVNGTALYVDNGWYAKG